MYALVDCNNFYVSCERVFQPHLNEKPVVVLSNNDGCVISRSYEAKDMGIPMGAPEFQYREMMKKNDVHVFSSNYPLYGDMSNRVMKLLEKFTPHIEVYSIDEAFLNFEGISIEDYNTHGLQIKYSIQKWLGLPVCIGFAKTKALTKVANKIAKKFQDRTKGVYVIDSEEKRIKALKWTKIEDVWGIGYKLSKKMKGKNIITAYDFTLPVNEAYIKKEMGIVGMRLKYELEGKSVIKLEEVKDKKNIAITRSFEGTISDFDQLKERVSTFASVCAEKLRKQQSCCQVVTLYLRKDQHKIENRNQQLSFYKQTLLPFSTQSSITISKAAISMLNELYKEKIAYKKAGVIVSQIIPEDKKQYQLFGEENPKHQLLMEAIDKYHKKIGKIKIKLGSQDLKKTWMMKQEHLSKKYTTDINQLLIVKC